MPEPILDLAKTTPSPWQRNMATRSALAHPDPAHPLNFGSAKKLLLLLCVSLAAWVANYSAAAHLTAFPEVAKDLHATIPAIANTIGISILGLGTGPLLWNPLARSLGRRPAMLFSWTLFVGCAFWLSFATSLKSFSAARFFSGFTAGSSQTIPAMILAETFTPQWRGTAISTWTLLLVLGPVTAPIVGAAVVERTSWRWIYHVVTILAGVVGLLMVAFLPETLYINSDRVSSVQTQDGAVQPTRLDDRQQQQQRQHDEKKSSFDHATDNVSPIASQHLASTSYPSHGDAGALPEYGRIGVAYYPWRDPAYFIYEALQPLLMARYIVVVVPSVLYAVVFMWSVGLTIVLPQVFEKPPWSFSALAVGAAFLSAAVGSTVGKFAGGYLADKTVLLFQRRAAPRHDVEGANEGARVVTKPEWRLWASMPHWPIELLGLLLFGIGLQHQLSWPTEVIGGLGLYYVATAALGGIFQTYICETYLEKSVHGIALFNLIKCALAFAAPFFIPEWAFKDFATSYIVQGVVALGTGLIGVLLLIWCGESIRKWQGMPVS
ncbi:hypothetical protein ACQY0O_001191 [Thecaphora frezii]